MKSFTGLILFTIIFATALLGRPKRVDQVPNGTVNSCLTCHTTAFGGQRNDFGQEIESSFLDGNGDVIWGPALAALDSDGDGATNGQELQDPTGEWAIGQSNPGDIALVSNPGDPNSTVGVDVFSYGLPSAFSLEQNYPNPFNPSTTISFTLERASNVQLTVHDIQGKLVAQVVNDFLPRGYYDYSFTADNLSSGFYVYTLAMDGRSISKKMTLLR